MKKLSVEQQLELKRIANDVVISNKWDELSWEDAWSGKRPNQPTDAEFGALVTKVHRFWEKRELDYECRSITEHIRMLFLENCESLDIYQKPEHVNS